MRQYWKLFCGMITLTAITACTNNELAQMVETQCPASGKVVSVTAYTAGDRTNLRVAYASNETDNGFTLTWDTEESFSVIRGGENQTFSKDAEGNTFTGTLPTDGEGDYYAFYPVTEATDADAAVLDLATQTGTLDSDKTYMYATSTDGETFNFEHRTAILKATFSGLPEDATISNVMVTAADESTITIAHKKAVATIQAHYIYLPPMAQADATLQFKVTASGALYLGTLSATKNIEAGKVYNADVTLVLACQLPDGKTVNSALSSAIGDKTVTSIVFEANSTLTGGTSIGGSSAYVLVDETTLKVYTAAQEFVFNEDCSKMFSDLGNIQSIEFDEYINTSNVMNMSYMFSSCYALKELDLDSFDTRKVTDMESLFNGCVELVSLDLGDNFKTLNVTNMWGMFASCTKLASLDLGSNFNTSNVINMYSMFGGCSKLTSLDLGASFNTSNVTDMGHMFQYCSSLASLDLGASFNTLKVTDMSYMFQNCSALASLDLGASFNTSNVADMNYMFFGCSSLASLDLGASFNTLNVKHMYGMFSGCSKLTSLDLGASFNTSKVIYLSSMFENCSALTSLDLTGFSFESNPNCIYMFRFVGMKYQEFDDNTGERKEENKISILVTEEGYDYLSKYYNEVFGRTTDIENSNAKLVKQ